MAADRICALRSHLQTLASLDAAHARALAQLQQDSEPGEQETYELEEFDPSAISPTATVAFFGSRGTGKEWTWFRRPERVLPLHAAHLRTRYRACVGCHQLSRCLVARLNRSLVRLCAAYWRPVVPPCICVLCDPC